MIIISALQHEHTNSLIDRFPPSSTVFINCICSDWCHDPLTAFLIAVMCVCKMILWVMLL